MHGGLGAANSAARKIPGIPGARNFNRWCALMSGTPIMQALPLAGEAKLVERESGAYDIFERYEWAALRDNTPLTLSNDDIASLRGVNEPISLTEVAEIHLPLSRLLNIQVAAAQSLSQSNDAFLGRLTARRPYIIAIAGSVAVGKSTFARILRSLLACWPDHPRVELVTTDGFLHPNRVLEQRGLMQRKGFPESYDLRRMLRFLADVKAGLPEVAVPVYSHLVYDIVSDRQEIVTRPDILIFEGLNVLQSVAAPVVASDFFDFSIYVDAEEADIEAWYVERFLLLQHTAFSHPASYFRRYQGLSREEAESVARGIWRRINLVNLKHNIVPTRGRARLILHKRHDHSVGEILLRRL